MTSDRKPEVGYALLPLRLRRPVTLGQMPSADLSRRVERVVGYPPLSDLSDDQRREFHEALLESDCFEGLPGKWQAANRTGRAQPAEIAAHHYRLTRGANLRDTVTPRDGGSGGCAAVFRATDGLRIVRRGTRATAGSPALGPCTPRSPETAGLS
jgi:hypothetical protein